MDEYRGGASAEPPPAVRSRDTHRLPHAMADEPVVCGKPESADHGDGSDDPLFRGNGITQNRSHDPRTLETAKAEFDRFTSQDATFIFVTNEIGCGGVSANAVQRRFTDLMGWMNQYVASQADEVILMVSGIPVKIK